MLTPNLSRRNILRFENKILGRLKIRNIFKVEENNLMWWTYNFAAIFRNNFQKEDILITTVLNSSGSVKNVWKRKKE